MKNLNGKKIILFAPQSTTGHYGNAIKTELENRGAVVFLYDERPSQKSFRKVFTRLTKNIAPQVFNKYLKRVVSKQPDTDIAYILICRAEAFTSQSIDFLRKSYPSTQIILYLWDTLKTNNKRNIIDCCDKAFSFDPSDCLETQNLVFRPTFFVSDYETITPNDKYRFDITFMGSLHLSRWEIIKRFKNVFLEQGYNPYFYLYVPSALYYIRDLFVRFPYAPLREVCFHPINLNDTLKIVQDSKCILDINYSFQKSLSTRPYEAMASKRKLITTNPEIKKYEFYKPNNILVVDINSPQIIKEFMDAPFEPIEDDIIYKYSVKGLVDDLFN